MRRTDARLFTERILDAAQHQPLTNAFHCGNARLQRLSDDCVSLLLMGQAQYMGTHQSTSRDTPFMGQSQDLG